MSARRPLRVPDQRHSMPRRSGIQESLFAAAAFAEAKWFAPPASPFPLGPGAALRLWLRWAGTRRSALRLRPRWAGTRWGARMREAPT